MSNDDSRGNESPDRRDASHRITTYRPILEALETHTANLYEAVTDDERLESETRRAAKRHCRELRAELDCVRRHLPATDGYHRPTRDDQERVTTISEPLEAAREAARRRDERQTVETENCHDDTDTEGERDD